MNLPEALNKTLELVERSNDALYSHTTVEEISRKLREAIGALEIDAPPDWTELGVLFGPTGAIQEIAIDNGWGDEFLQLASMVDAYVRR